MFPIPIQKRPLINQISYKILIPISLFIWLIPLIGIMLTSIRGLGDITAGNYWGMPSEFLLFSNIKDVFQNTPMLSYIINSFKITIPTVIGAVAVSCMTGFALASYKFKANLFIFFTFIAGNFVPFQILMIPVRDLTFQMGLYDTVTGLVLFHVAFQTGFCTLFMRNFIKALPHELFEAARIDGTSEFNIFFKIVLPLTRPAIAALSVLIFTFIWNDFFWATVFSAPRAISCWRFGAGLVFLLAWRSRLLVPITSFRIFTYPQQGPSIYASFCVRLSKPCRISRGSCCFWQGVSIHYW